MKKIPFILQAGAAVLISILSSGHCLAADDYLLFMPSASSVSYVYDASHTAGEYTNDNQTVLSFETGELVQLSIRADFDFCIKNDSGTIYTSSDISPDGNTAFIMPQEDIVLEFYDTDGNVINPADIKPLTAGNGSILIGGDAIAALFNDKLPGDETSSAEMPVLPADKSAGSVQQGNPAGLTGTLDAGIPDNYVPVPGSVETYMVLDNDGRVTDYVVGQKSGDSWTFRELLPQIIDAGTAKNVFAVIGNDGDLTYYLYSRDENGNYGFTNCDINGRMEDNNSHAVNDAQITVPETESENPVQEEKMNDFLND